MRTRSLGKTGIEVSELGLGTWGLSGDGYGAQPPGEARRVIDSALGMGITLFETASSYGRGAMEQTLGDALAASERDVTVVTKWGTDRDANPPHKHFDETYLRACAERSRTRLGAETRVVALLHNPSMKTLSNGSVFETMKQLVSEQLITAWGVSAGDEPTARAALDADAQVLSLAHNVLMVQPLRALAEVIRAKGVGLLAHSVLFYGLLAGRWSANRTFRIEDHRSERWPPGALGIRIGHLDAIRPMVSGEVLSMRSAAVRFVLENALVSSAVLGPRNNVQLIQLVRETSAEPPYLSEGKMSGLEGRLRNLEVPR